MSDFVRDGRKFLVGVRSGSATRTKPVENITDPDFWNRARRWRANFERDHPECCGAFKELLEAHCREGTLFVLLVNLANSVGRSLKNRGDLETLAANIRWCAKEIEGFGQSTVAGVVDERNEWDLLANRLRDFAATISKGIPSVPNKLNVWENRALMLLEDYVRARTGHLHEKALNTLAFAVLGKRVFVRLRVRRFKEIQARTELGAAKAVVSARPSKPK